MANLNWTKNRTNRLGRESISQAYRDEARLRRLNTPLQVAREAMLAAERKLRSAENILAYGHTDEREEIYLMALATYTEAEAVFLLLKDAKA